jgi:sporulation protein YlmC with PRC-barrel domain
MSAPRWCTNVQPHQTGEGDPVAHSVNTDDTMDMIASSKVAGTAVYDISGARMGTIHHFIVMVDKTSGQAEYVVMQFGGLHGIAAEYYPIPWDLLRYDVAQGGYVVDLDREMLNGAPRYGDREPSFDAQYNQQVYTYYGLTPPDRRARAVIGIPGRALRLPLQFCARAERSFPE